VRDQSALFRHLISCSDQFPAQWASVLDGSRVVQPMWRTMWIYEGRPGW